MLSFCMLDFAGFLLMNIAEAILNLRYQTMSLETAVDAAFGCVADHSLLYPLLLLLLYVGKNVAMHSFQSLQHASTCLLLP